MAQLDGTSPEFKKLMQTILLYPSVFSWLQVLILLAVSPLPLQQLDAVLFIPCHSNSL